MKKQTDKELTEYMLSTLNLLKEEGKKKLHFETVQSYESIQEFVQEGYVYKEDRIYSLTEKGEAFLFECSKKLDKKQELEERHRKTKVMEVSYKELNEAHNHIETKTQEFELDPVDGLPVIVVEEASYTGLLNRDVGQHWRKFIGEAGRKLIRDKKIRKFYVENKGTNRRYLYIIPEKKEV